MEGLVEGRIVHYILNDGHNSGQCRPAIVVRTWNNQTVLNTINLIVFTDALNDCPPGTRGSDGHFWATSVRYSETKELGTWHWPERV